MNRKREIGFVLASVLIVGAVIYRILPHPYNFAPITGMALLGGAYIKNKGWALSIPLIALFIGDIVINNGIFRESFSDEKSFVLFSPYMWYVYSAFILITFMGVWFLKKIRIPRLALVTLGSSLMFFVITNFGSWLGGAMYPKTFAGLGMCFTAALPFFKNSLLGDLFFTGVLFGAYELLFRGYLKFTQVQSTG